MHGLEMAPRRVTDPTEREEPETHHERRDGCAPADRSSALVHDLRNKLTAVAGNAAVIAQHTGGDSFEAAKVAAIAHELVRVTDEAIDLMRRIFATAHDARPAGSPSPCEERGHLRRAVDQRAQ